MGFFKDLFDPGHKDRAKAGAAADRAQVKGGSMVGPGGLGATFNFDDKTGKGTFSNQLGSFDPLMAQMQGLAGGFFGQAGAGVPPELQAIFQSAQQDLATPNLQYSNFAPQMQGLSQMFANALPTATADPFALGQGVSDKLRALSERSNQDLVNQKFDQLHGSGRLGHSVGVAEAYELDRNLRDQGMRFDLAGLEAGQGIQQQARQGMFNANQGLSSLFGQAFGERTTGKELLANFANARFGMGSMLERLRLGGQAQNFGQGLQAAQGATQISQLPLAFQQAMMQAQSIKSNADLGTSATHAENAANAKSPFLEALNAAGQIAAGIGTGGISTALQGLFKQPAVSGGFSGMTGGWGTT